MQFFSTIIQLLEVYRTSGRLTLKQNKARGMETQKNLSHQKLDYIFLALMKKFYFKKMHKVAMDLNLVLFLTHLPKHSTGLPEL